VASEAASCGCEIVRDARSVREPGTDVIEEAADDAR
jgi:hypothetical protein